jgi:hypothetical protein
MRMENSLSTNRKEGWSQVNNNLKVTNLICNVEWKLLPIQIKKHNLHSLYVTTKQKSLIRGGSIITLISTFLKNIEKFIWIVRIVFDDWCCWENWSIHSTLTRPNLKTVLGVWVEQIGNW